MKTLKLLFIVTIIIASYTLTAQVAITTDGSDPDGSAMLDVKSTEKGVLIPRLTQTEIESILDPANGLTVFCTTDDTFYAFIFADNKWKEIEYGTGRITPNPPEAGDSYGGGIVAYIFVDGDNGYVVGETHGIIAATSDQSTGIHWYNGYFTTTGAVSAALGAGSANTTTIILNQLMGSYAANICRNYTGGGYTDWCLPSRDELNKLYLYNKVNGGFDSVWYWSSTEQETSNIGAHAQLFDINGQQSMVDKSSDNLNVRAIRTF